MFKNLMQKLRGGTPTEQAVADARSEEIQQQRIDSAAGIVDGEAVMPIGESVDFTADQEPPSDPG
jgi:hypothetical protein